MAFSQYAETIQSGRPGQSIGSHVVGKNIFQLQSGFSYGESTIGSSISLESSDFNNVFRYGLSEYFEVNGALTYGWLETDGNFDQSSFSGWTQAELGVRTNIYNGEGLIPSVGFQYRLRLPNDLDLRHNSSSIITLVTQQDIGTFGFTTNLGINWVGRLATEVGFYVLNLSTGISDDIGIFVEHYGFIESSNWLGKFDGGFAFLATNDLQLDISGGWGSLGQDEESFFVSAGFSLRTARKKD